ncbi:2-dehydro-3-deoxygluconokinase [Virgibacillus phasianinus]|uniref:2-dehydro-3-deoxygluconokinase n=1 Tax=Virgibacillus phasianinus TaxID=2017483 RepID=A0A220U732_9BACI|nr:sugar kinase [Virgibacillus phasianinus]ASK63855.1 2-dehydro-3-deoxygluconokinase [Virgibacillus phasianinus]
MKKVITFGEAMTMFVATEAGSLEDRQTFNKYLAGAETNVAIGLSRLGFDVGFSSRVGQDSLGRFISSTLAKENIDISHISLDPNYPTGFQLKSNVGAGDPVVEYFRGFSAFRQLRKEDINQGWVKQADHLHLTGIPIALSETVREYTDEMIELAHKYGITISFDPNLRPVLWSNESTMTARVNQIAFQADWMFPGITEGQQLTGYENPRDIASFYLDKGVKLVVIKLGEKGAYYRTNDAEGTVEGYFVEQVIDTVGAGDGFAVGTISGLLENLTVPQAVARGNAVGALAIQSQGDSDGLPTRQQLNKFIHSHIKQGVK